MNAAATATISQKKSISMVTEYVAAQIKTVAPVPLLKRLQGNLRRPYTFRTGVRDRSLCVVLWYRRGIKKPPDEVGIAALKYD